MPKAVVKLTFEKLVDVMCLQLENCLASITFGCDCLLKTSKHVRPLKACLILISEISLGISMSGLEEPNKVLKHTW